MRPSSEFELFLDLFILFLPVYTLLHLLWFFGLRDKNSLSIFMALNKRSYTWSFLSNKASIKVGSPFGVRDSSGSESTVWQITHFLISQLTHLGLLGPDSKIGSTAALLITLSSSVLHLKEEEEKKQVE